eukprot:ANDGO_00804.mRNA.1 AUGMIN subunit 6
MEAQLFVNLQLLGLDIRKASQELGTPFHADMFSKTSIKVFEAVLYFLMTKVDPKSSQELLSPHYPCIDRTYGRSFRKGVLDIVTALEKDMVLPPHTLRSSDLQSCVGKRIVVAFWRLSVLALQNVIRRDFETDLSLGMLAVAPSRFFSVLEKCSTAAIHLRIRQEVTQFLSMASSMVDNQKVWSDASQRWNVQYRGLQQQLVKEMDEIKSQTTPFDSSSPSLHIPDLEEFVFEDSAQLRALISRLDAVKKTVNDMSLKPEETNVLTAALGTDHESSGPQTDPLPTASGNTSHPASSYTGSLSVLHPLSSTHVLSEGSDLALLIKDYRETVSPLLNTIAPIGGSSPDKQVRRLSSLETRADQLDRAAGVAAEEVERHASYRSAMSSFRDSLSEMCDSIQKEVEVLQGKLVTATAQRSPMTTSTFKNVALGSDSHLSLLPPTPVRTDDGASSPASETRTYHGTSRSSYQAPLSVARSNRRVVSAEEMEFEKKDAARGSHLELRILESVQQTVAQKADQKHNYHRAQAEHVDHQQSSSYSEPSRADPVSSLPKPSALDLSVGLNFESSGSSIPQMSSGRYGRAASGSSGSTASAKSTSSRPLAASNARSSRNRALEALAEDMSNSVIRNDQHNRVSDDRLFEDGDNAFQSHSRILRSP